MSYTYKFDPGANAFPLKAKLRADAEDRLRKSLAIQSLVPGRAPPDAIVLLYNGLEVWRWTQEDRWAL